MYVTDAGCPHPSCGAAFVSFVYMSSQPQPAATATIATFEQFVSHGTFLATRYNTPPAALSADSAKEPSAEYGGPLGP